METVGAKSWRMREGCTLRRVTRISALCLVLILLHPPESDIWAYTMCPYHTYFGYLLVQDAKPNPHMFPIVVDKKCSIFQRSVADDVGGCPSTTLGCSENLGHILELHQTPFICWPLLDRTGLRILARNLQSADESGGWVRDLERTPRYWPQTRD